MVIKTYKKLWRLDYKVYALGTSLTLPRPLPVRFAAYLCVAAAIMALLNKQPFMASVPFVIKWVLIPGGIAKLMDTVKLDGKNPVLYFSGYLRFLVFEKGIHLEHFREHGIQGTFSMYWEAGQECRREKQQRAVRVVWDGGMRGGDIFV